MGISRDVHLAVHSRVRRPYQSSVHFLRETSEGVHGQVHRHAEVVEDEFSAIHSLSERQKENESEKSLFVSLAIASHIIRRYWDILS